MRIRTVLALGLMLSTGAFAAPPKVVGLSLLPTTFRLDGAEARHRLVVLATFADGARRDVTDQAAFSSASPKVCRVDSGALAVSVGEGDTELAARWGGRSVRATVAVRGARTPRPVSFAGDVVPTLAKLGCSAGTCHGAQSGKGGFRLSLRGYAPELDFASITRQLRGRRVNPEDPARSLFLRKPLGELPHRGGKALNPGSPEHRLLLDWLRAGAPGPDPAEAGVARLTLLPPERERLTPGDRQRLVVQARYTDGRVEDVTGRALFSSNDPAVASVDDAGRVKIERPGETAVMVRYRDQLTTARFTAPFPQTIDPRAFADRNGVVDARVAEKLAALNIPPSPLCTDAEFLRRASLSALGTLPTAAEARAFLADARPDKRDRLVDALLQRPEWGLVWSLKLGDLFVLRREYLSRKNAVLLQGWLAERFNANTPWDRLVTELLTATGDPEENPAALFFISRAPQKSGERYWVRGTEATAEMVSQVFLGRRIACAKCHNHPTEAVTQDDYYRWVALWQQVHGAGNRDGILPERLDASASGEVRQPRTGQLMEPRPLDRSDPGFAQGEDRRVKAARWIVQSDDFARAIVNRVWARCFGRGLVEPIDDVRPTNPSVNEPLLRALAADLRRHDFDLKWLTATLLKSRTFQRSATPLAGNRADTRWFSHFLPRRLPAEELADAIGQATGVWDRYQSLPPGARAIEVADAEIPSVLLDTFGRPPRVICSDGERILEPALGQALALLNGSEVQAKVTSGAGVLPELLKARADDAEVLEELFLSTVSRRPSPAEAQKLLAAVRAAPNRAEGFQDLLWALVNSAEFLFNH